mmetsp:Transcript_20317/g.44212  ORF Transcript_20317/g.44212 Transcript_20317/m.44212 type:complete len:299 (+) Transcript_20317:118-1014(+)
MYLLKFGTNRKKTVATTRSAHAVVRFVVLGIVVALSAILPRRCSGYSILPQNINHGNNNSNSNNKNKDGSNINNGNTRRGFFETASTTIAATTAFLLVPAVTVVALPQHAKAFDNRIDDRYASTIPQTGTQPKDLGHSQRSNYVGLKACGNSPNCWNSSAPKANIPARWLPAWEAPASPKKGAVLGSSIADVKRVIDTYQVGQNDVDGGGFKVIEYKNDKGDDNEHYLYVQFQSYKAGYIDDFECWFNPESQKFDVRSSSRVGYSDLGVNAIRLEYIANRLEKECGWTFERRKNGKLV